MLAGGGVPGGQPADCRGVSRGARGAVTPAVSPGDVPKSPMDQPCPCCGCTPKPPHGFLGEQRGDGKKYGGGLRETSRRGGGGRC